MDTGCKEPNKAGKPCGATHYRDGFCRWHHPDLEAQRQAERIAGGKAKANDARARKKVLAAGLSLEAVDAALCGALLDLLDGKLEPNVGTAAATIARTIATVRQQTTLEARISALEDRTGLNEGQAS